jgi:hypothetical protein
MAEMADAADSKSADPYQVVGVRPPLPAPFLANVYAASSSMRDFVWELATASFRVPRCASLSRTVQRLRPQPGALRSRKGQSWQDGVRGIGARAKAVKYPKLPLPGCHRPIPQEHAGSDLGRLHGGGGGWVSTKWFKGCGGFSDRLGAPFWAGNHLTLSPPASPWSETPRPTMS